MYLSFYQLKAEPFKNTPDPNFLYLSPSHKEALASLVYGIEAHKGFITVTGEVGAGKTTIIRTFLDNVQSDRYRVIYVFDPHVTFHDLLYVTLQELDVPIDDQAGDQWMFRRLQSYLIEEYKQGRNVILVIDEAQNMPLETLESLRILSNLETADDKLLQIVFVGQPEFEEVLRRHDIRQLHQRIAIRARLRRLSPRESGEYIAYRLSRVTDEVDQVFTAESVNRIIWQSQGIPRIINTLCDNALIAGYGYLRKPITRDVIQEVISDYLGTSVNEYQWLPE